MRFARHRSTLVLFGLLLVSVLAFPLFAQEEVQTTPQVVPASSEPATNPAVQLISTQVVVSYLLVWIGEVMKRTKSIPWVQEGAATANRVMAWIFAVAQSVGISYNFDTVTGTLMITGLSLSIVVPMFVEIGRAFVTQKLLWVLAFRPTEADRAFAVRKA